MGRRNELVTGDKRISEEAVKRTAAMGADVALAPGADLGLEAVLDFGLLIAGAVCSDLTLTRASLMTRTREGEKNR